MMNGARTDFDSEARIVHGRAASSYLIEVDGAGLSYEGAVSDLAALGIEVQSLDKDATHWRLIGGIPDVAQFWRLTAGVTDAAQMEPARAVLESYFGGRLKRCVDRVLATHRGGKIRVVATAPLSTADDLSLAYTPGVGRVCELIAAYPRLADELTARANTVAIVTDGTAVLGLGNLG